MGRKRSKNSNDPIECIPFQAFAIVSASTNTNQAAPDITTISVDPSIDIARIANISDYFLLYRVSRLRVILFPHTIPVSGFGSSVSAVGYLPGSTDTAPTTYNQIMNLPAKAYHGYGKSINTIMSVPKKVIMGDNALQWYKTKAGTPDSQFEVQGVLYFAANGTATTTYTWTYCIEGEFQFKGRAGATQTPLTVQVKPKEQLMQTADGNVLPPGYVLDPSITSPALSKDSSSKSGTWKKLCREGEIMLDDLQADYVVVNGWVWIKPCVNK